MVSPSILRMSVLERLAVAATLIAVLWGAVIWAMKVGAVTAALKFRNLTLGYDRHPAVHHLDGTIEAARWSRWSGRTEPASPRCSRASSA